MMNKVHVYMWWQTASIKSTAGNKTRLFPSPLHISTSSRLTLAEAFRNDHIAACTITLAVLLRRMNRVFTYPFRVRPKWHSIVAQRIGLKSSDVISLVTTEHIRNKCSLLKSRSVIIATIVIANLLTLSILIHITAQNIWKGGFFLKIS